MNVEKNMSDQGFHTIEEAKREVRVAAERVYDRYVEDGLRMKVPFLGVGMQYIRFAKEEPQLYRLLFLTTNENGNSSVMDAIHHSQDLVRESLQQIILMHRPQTAISGICGLLFMAWQHLW